MPVPGCNTGVGAVQEACTGEATYLGCIGRHIYREGGYPSWYRRDIPTQEGYNREDIPTQGGITGRFMLLREARKGGLCSSGRLERRE